MLPTKFRFIWPSGFRGEEFKKSANQKQESPVVAMFVIGSGRNEQSLQRTFHRCFLPSFGSFGQVVSEEKIFKNRPIRNKNCLWWPCLLMDCDKMSNLYRGFDGTTLKLALNSHNRPSLTFFTPKCYKIHQGVMLQLQYEYYAIFWKIFPMH